MRAQCGVMIHIWRLYRETEPTLKPNSILVRVFCMPVARSAMPGTAANACSECLLTACVFVTFLGLQLYSLGLHLCGNNGAVQGISQVPGHIQHADQVFLVAFAACGSFCDFTLKKGQGSTWVVVTFVGVLRLFLMFSVVAVLVALLCPVLCNQGGLSLTIWQCVAAMHTWRVRE